MIEDFPFMLRLGRSILTVFQQNHLSHMTPYGSIFTYRELIKTAVLKDLKLITVTAAESPKRPVGAWAGQTGSYAFSL
ncbi:MAG TPA: hypothetical protein VE131_01810 [Terriglobales bacterium]|nr:hypothetical protein [Terriglobales bacterium]